MKLKERAKVILTEELLRLENLGRRVFTVKQLAEFVNESRQRIGYWLKEKGFEKLGRKRIGKAKTTKYFLSQGALENLKKPRRMGFYCSRCGFKGYYDLQSDEKLEGTSYIVKKNDPEDFKLAYCPDCNRMDRWASYSKDLDPKELKRKVVFTARPVKNTRGIVTGGPLFPKERSRPTVRELVDEFPETDSKQQ